VISLQSVAHGHRDGVQPRRANSRTLCQWERLGHSNLLDVRYSGSMRPLVFFGGPREARNGEMAIERNDFEGRTGTATRPVAGLRSVCRSLGWCIRQHHTWSG
jgi:hypothetical protein